MSGTVLRLSGDSGSAVEVSSNAATSQPVGAPAEGTPTDPPYPTPERVTASEVGSVAAANGVPASLAAAIAWQESGFNNDLVSSADARGVMQILPGTWDWIQHSLDTGGPPLAPASAADNVRGGVLLLHSLLNSTGGDPAMAAAGYYQGLPSVLAARRVSLDAAVTSTTCSRSSVSSAADKPLRSRRGAACSTLPGNVLRRRR